MIPTIRVYPSNTLKEVLSATKEGAYDKEI